MNQLSTWTDETRVAQFVGGDVRAFDHLYNKYYAQVLAKCLSFTKCSSQADDLAQEIFIKVYHSLHRFEGKSKFSTWLFTLTSNYCIDYFRKSQRSVFVIGNEYIPDYAEEVSDEQNDIEADALMATLSDLEKSLLTMKYKEGKSIQDLCVLFDMKSSAVKMKLSRAKAKLNRTPVLAA